MQTLHALFDWMLDVSLRASLLSVAVILIQLALRGHLPARWRYALWLPVLLVLILPVLPESRWSAENLVVERVPVSLAPAAFGTSLEATTVSAAPAVAEQTIEARPSMGWKDIAGCAWLAGWGISLVAGVTSYLLMLRRFRTTSSPPPAELRVQVEFLSKELRIRAPRTLLSGAVESPAVAGLFRPVLLLPATFGERFSPGEAELVLKHELMHLRRRDLPMNAVLCFLQAMHWFNPVLWLAAARARLDREAACDAQVLASETRDRRNDYGHALLKVESCYCPRGFSLGLVGMFGQGRSLKSRINAIARHRRTHPAAALALASLIVLLGMVGATRASVNPQSQPLVGLDIQLMEFKAEAGETIKLTRSTQACARDSIEDGRASEPLLISANQLAELKMVTSANKAWKTVDYPRMVTHAGEKMRVASVVNQPFQNTSLAIGTQWFFTPEIKDNGIETDCKLHFSEIPEGVSSDDLQTAKTPKEAVAMLRRMDHYTKFACEPGQTAVMSMAWPVKPGSGSGSKRRLVLLAITPSLVKPVSLPEPESASPSSQSFTIGQSAFPFGDSVKIITMENKGSEVEVTGSYNLVSQEWASLDFYVTAIKPNQPASKFDRRQSTRITKGSGQFTLVHPAPYHGLPHLSLYTIEDGRPTRDFGCVYFGTPEEAAASQKLPLRFGKTPTSPTPGTVVLQDRLKQIVLPSLKFKETPLKDVVDYLKMKSRELDPARQGVNVLARPGEKRLETPITLTLTNVTLGDALHAVADLAGMRMQVQAYAVILDVARPTAAAAPAPAPAAAAPLLQGDEVKRAERIILPFVEFRDATVEEAIEFFRTKSLAHDPDKKGVKILLRGDAKSAPKLTLSLKDVPLMEALRYTAELAQLQLKAAPDGLVLAAPEAQRKSSDAGNPGADAGRFVIQIGKDGSLAANGKTVSRSELEAELKSLAAVSKNQAVIIRPDATTTYRHIQDALEAAQKVGLWNVGLATPDSKPASLAQ